ncbi:hypothetical protein PAMA_007304 [Pampus argenteus]
MEAGSSCTSPHVGYTHLQTVDLKGREQGITSQTVAPVEEEEDEGEDEESTADPQKSADEPEDKKEEEYDEEGDEEKAAVDVIKPVPEPEEEATGLPRIVGLDPKMKRIRKMPAILRVGPCRPAPVYCPSPPGWYVHHVVTDNPYPPPMMKGIYTVVPSVAAPSAPVLTAHPVHPGPPPLQPLYAHYQPYQQPVMQPPPEPEQQVPLVPPVESVQPEATEPESPVQPEVQTPAAEVQPAAVKEPAARKEKNKSPAVAKKDPEPRPNPIRLRTRLESDKNVTSAAKSPPEPGKAEKAEKKSVKEAQEEPQTEDNTTEKKKPGQRYFQCIYVPGKNAQYPLRPFTPAMSPTMMSPALKSMLEQQRASRMSGQ